MRFTLKIKRNKRNRQNKRKLKLISTFSLHRFKHKSKKQVFDMYSGDMSQNSALEGE